MVGRSDTSISGQLMTAGAEIRANQIVYFTVISQNVSYYSTTLLTEHHSRHYAIWKILGALYHADSFQIKSYRLDKQ